MAKGEAALIQQLAVGASVAEAAKAAAVSRQHVYNRLDDESFRAEIRRVRLELFEQTMGKLSDAATTAAQVLADLQGNNDPRIRLLAAKTVLQLRSQLWQESELEARIAALEQMAKRGLGPFGKEQQP